MAKSQSDAKPLSPKARTGVITCVKALVLKHHFNAAGIDYSQWIESVDQHTPELLRADIADFERGVCDLVAKLGSSHTLFYLEGERQVLPQHSINATLRPISADGVGRWMFLDVFEDGPAQIAGIKPGDLLLALDGIECKPPAMPPFGIGRKHHLIVSDVGRIKSREVEVTVPYRRATRSLPAIVEPRSISPKMISPGVGLLKILYFPGEMGMRFAKQLDAAISGLKKHDIERLVIDLRGNVGGGLGLARLASYLCPGRLPIGHNLTPRSLRAGLDASRLPRVSMPTDRTGLLLTLARFSIRDKSLVLLTQGLGPQPFHDKIAILVNEYTNSAAEMVAGFAADHRLATLVGEKTAGNVLGARNFKVGSGYTLRLPIFGWYTPRGARLEGNGVIPDVKVEVDPCTLSNGVDQQLNKALEIIDRGRS